MDVGISQSRKALDPLEFGDAADTGRERLCGAGGAEDRLDRAIGAGERQSVVSPAPALVTEVVREIVTSLGPNHAMMPNNFVRITPAVRAHCGQPGRSVATQSIRGAWLIPRVHGQADCVRRTSGRASTLGSHQRGIPPFARFQLDTVEGVRSSAAATLTVPPRSSMIWVAVCMAQEITINVI